MFKIERLNHCLNQVGTFSEEELQQIMVHCTHSEVSKDTRLLKAGDICMSISFLIKGACYQYHEETTDIIITELFTEKDCVLNQASFVSQKPSTETIKSYTDCEVLTLTVHGLHKLIGISPVFFQLGKIFELSAFRLSFFDQSLSPSEKYKYILEQKPKLIQTFPLRFIASYLKITPETLSRVRALK